MQMFDVKLVDIYGSQRFAQLPGEMVGEWLIAMLRVYASDPNALRHTVITVTPWVTSV